MKKFLFLVVIAICCVGVYGQNGTIALQSKKGAVQVCTNDSFNSFDATFSFDGIQSSQVTTEKGTFSVITMPETFPTGRYGTPELPAARKLIAVPQGATPRVVIKNYTETEYKLDEYGITTIFPHQPSVRKDMKPEDIKFIYNASAYSKKGFEERPVAEVQILGNARGLRIGTLTVYPVIYDASTNTIKVRNDIEVEVVFDNADKALTQSTYEKTFSIYFNDIYKQVFNRDVYDEHPDLFNTPTYMLVIAPDSYASTLQPWIEWKTKKGIYVDVHYTSETGTTYNAIKNFVYDKYNTGVAQGKTPTFLVLVGDTPQIPNTTGSASEKVTDLYYSSVDGDDFPDMYCSRMCCSTTTELANLIEKILCYEEVQTDPSYIGNALLIAGADSNWNPKVGQPTINYGTQNHFNAAHNYTNIYAYLSSYANCYSHLNDGIGLVNYTAHGSETGWYSPAFSVSDADALTNNGKYFLAIGNCCLAADYGYSGVCLGEAMIRGHQKGAYTYIGSCPSTYWYEDYYWSVGATNVFNQTPTPQNSSIGVYDVLNWDTAFNTVNSIVFLGNLAVTYAHDNSYEGSISTQYYWQAYHCLGDGSVMPFCGMPTNNTVSHMAIFPIGLSTYEVSAEPGSIVAISKDGVLHGTAVVDATGTVQVPVDPVLSSGYVTIVVTGHNKYPHIDSIPAAALSGPYIIADSYQLDGDNVLSYGETTGMSITMKNVGNDPTVGNTTVTISCNDPLLTINNSTVTYGLIAPNETQTQSGFNMTVSPEIENGHSFNITVMAANSDTTWQSTLHLTAYKPVLAYSGMTWDGSYTPGQTLNLVVTAINNGGFPVSNVSGTVTTASNYVTINGATQNFGNIAAGATAQATYSVTISADCPETEVINFAINLTGDNGAITGSGDFQISNSCNIQFDLTDSYGDGWNGASLVVSFSDGSPSQTLTVSSGHTAQYIMEVNSGTVVSLTWQSGSYDSECSFVVSYQESGATIYQSNGTLVAGLLTSFTMDCGVTCSGVSNLKAIAGGSGTMNVTWTAPEGSVVSYNVYRDNVLVANVTVPSYTDTNLPDATYTYCVEPIYADGCIGMLFCAEGVCGDFYNMLTTGTSEVTLCSGIIYDDGGPDANYSNNCDGIMIVHASTTGAKVHLSGSYVTENNYDKLYIYDGEGTSGTLLGTFMGTGTLDVTSTGSTLTLHFTSDNSVNKAGFALTVACEGGVSTLLGDANNDNLVNIADVAAVVAYMMEQNPSPFILTNADINSDGIINVIDIQGIINIILGDDINKCDESSIVAKYYVKDGYLYIDSPVAISALQIQLNGKNTGDIRTMEVLNGFEKSASWIDESEYMLIAYNMKHLTIAADNKMPLMYIGNVTVGNIVLSDNHGCGIDVEKGTEGIGDIISTTSKPYPNPFNVNVTIPYTVASNSSVECVITNINGQTVDYRNINSANAGSNSITWTPSDKIESGIYFVTIKINGVDKQISKVIYQK